MEKTENLLLAYAELEEVLGSSYDKIEEVFRNHGYDDSIMQPHNMRVFMNQKRREGISSAQQPT